MKLKMESSEKEFEDLVKKKQEEIQYETDMKVLNLRKWYLRIELILSIVGYGVIIYAGGWILGIGFYLVNWGNNMGMLRTVYKEANGLIRNIWTYGT